MKKSLIALAVSSAVVAPASVQAAEVSGWINTTVESSSIDSDGQALTTGGELVIFNTTNDETGLSDTSGSRFRMTGSEDLGNGLTAGYTFEFDIATSFGGSGGSSNEDAAVTTRLSNVTLGGDFGTLKMGTQWGLIYEYSGWNHFRTDGHGGATHYYMTAGLEDDPYGLRVDNAISYTYGGGGYSSDPFTFSIQVRTKDQSSSGTDLNGDGDFNDAFGTDLDGDGTIQADEGRVEVAPVNDDETIDNVTLAAQGTFADFTVNGVLYSENNTTGAEESLFTLGGRWSSGPFYVGGTFFQRDRDTGLNNAEEPSGFNLLGGMDFGSGYSGYLGVGTVDADTNSGVGDMDTVFLQAQKSLSSRTKVYGEFETATTDSTGTGGADGETSVVAIGLKHSF